MEEIDYHKLLSSIHKYGAHAEIEVKPETCDLYDIVRRQGITMSIKFYDRSGFDDFAKDMILLENLKEEHWTRMNNPTVAQAYEEYQILLKLSK